MPNPLAIDRDAAYECWLATGRNVSETARRLSVNRTTVQYWKQADDWDRRYLESLPANARAGLELARIDVAEAIQAGIPEMREIMLGRAVGYDDADRPYFLTADKDRVNAFRALIEAEKALQLLERNERGAMALPVIDVYRAAQRQAAGQPSEPESILDAVSHVLEANIASSTR